MTSSTLDARFLETDIDNAPKRERLRLLSATEKKTIGEDVKTDQFGWPLGVPLVAHLGDGIWEAYKAGEAHRADILRARRKYHGITTRLHQETAKDAQARS